VIAPGSLGSPLPPGSLLPKEPPRPRLWPAYTSTFSFMLGQWAAFLAVPLLVTRLGGGAAEAGAIVATRSVFQAVVSLPLGAVADSLGPRTTLAGAVAANAVINLIPLVAAVSGWTLPLYAWALLSGAAAGLYLPAMSAYVAGAAGERRRGSAFGWLTLFTHSGVAVGPAIGGIAWDAGGPLPAFIIASLLGLLAIIGPLVMRGDVRTRIDFSGVPAAIAAVARDRLVVAVWLSSTAIGLPWGTVSALMPIFATSIGITAATVGLVLAAQSLVNAASRVPLGRIIDRRGVSPLLIAGAAATYGLILSLLGLQNSPLGIGLVISLGVLAIALGVMGIQVFLSSRVAPQLRATALGGYNAFLSAGLGLGPLLAGTVSDAAGFAAGFASAGLAGVAVAIVAARIAVLARRGPRAIQR
jgi:MFS family permease